jgi:hypothetical protein
MAGIRGDSERQARHEEIARHAYAKAAWFRDRESEYALADAVHREYMEKTAPERRLAVAADAEYRNRHPGEKLEPLRSAEPEPVTDEEREAFWPGQDSAERDVSREAQQETAAADKDGQAGGRSQRNRRQEATAGGPDAARQETATEADKTPLGRGGHEPQPEGAEVPGWVKKLAERVARAEEKLAERQAVQVPSEDPEAEGPGMAWPDLLDRERDPLLHPAALNMRPSAGVLAEAARQAGSQAEAGGPEAGG